MISARCRGGKLHNASSAGASMSSSRMISRKVDFSPSSATTNSTIPTGCEENA
jgi:hypothetical protein